MGGGATWPSLESTPCPRPLHFHLHSLCCDFTVHQSEEGLPAVGTVETHAAPGPPLGSVLSALPPPSDLSPLGTAPMSSQPVKSVALDMWLGWSASLQQSQCCDHQGDSPPWCQLRQTLGWTWCDPVGEVAWRGMTSTGSCRCPALQDRNPSSWALFLEGWSRGCSLCSRPAASGRWGDQ